MKTLIKTATLALLVTSSLTAFAATRPDYQYKCLPGKDNSLNDSYEVLVTKGGDVVKLDGHELTITTNYSPSKNKGYMLYNGDTDFLNSEDGNVDVLVSKTLTYGAEKGSIKIVARGEGYSVDFFSCELE